MSQGTEPRYLLKFYTNRNYFVRFLTDLRILIRTSLRIEARLAKHDSHQTGRIAWSLSSKGGIWSIRPILKSKSSQASLEVSGSALHAEDQQCEREGPYDMTIWTGPEAEKKNTLERMLCLYYDRQRKKVKSPFDFSRAFLLNKNSGFNLWNFLVASGTPFFRIYRKDDDHRERIFVLFDSRRIFRKMSRKFSCHLSRFPKSLNFWSNGERPKSQITTMNYFSQYLWLDPAADLRWKAWEAIRAFSGLWGIQNDVSKSLSHNS